MDSRHEVSGRLNPFFMAGMLVLFFLVWVFCFRGFIFDEIPLQSDAVAYFEHFKFFTDQLQRGIFPLWDPSQLNGLPIELFLRRIGSFNPFVYFLIALKATPLPYPVAYFLFLSGYYFFGMIGFYLLADQIFRRQWIAFTASGLLMFSSLGTRLFDSYFLLTVIPMIWFFYFLLRFTRNPGVRDFLGLILTAMVLLSTYIPFYFFNILILVCFFFILVYWRSLKTIGARYGVFIRAHPWLVAFGVFCVALAMFPGLFFFAHEANQGEIAMPARHGEIGQENVLGVRHEVVTSWGIEEDLQYASVFSDFRRFKFAVFYLPVFALMVWIMGTVTRLTSKIVMFFLCLVALFAVFSPYLPIHQFLYDHVFYFRYFRNLHFFLWMAILPLGVLFLASLLESWEDQIKKSETREYSGILVLILHAGVLLYTLFCTPFIFSTLIALVLSCLFFWWVACYGTQRHGYFLIVLLWLAIVSQPLQVYYFLMQNSWNDDKPMYLYLDDYLGSFKENGIFMPKEDKKILADMQTKLLRESPDPVTNADFSVFYLEMANLQRLRHNLNRDILALNNYRRFLAYDRVEFMAEDSPDYRVLGEAFLHNRNVAYVMSHEIPDMNGAVDSGDHAMVLESGMPQIQLIDMDVNHFKFNTDFSSQKFLVFNHNYHQDWHLLIDGEHHSLYRANMAFMGFVVPEGRHQVVLRFGAPWKYALNYSLLGITTVLFFWIVVLSLKTGEERPAGCLTKTGS